MNNLSLRVIRPLNGF